MLLYLLHHIGKILFRGHVDGSKVAVCGTLSKIDEIGRERERE